MAEKIIYALGMHITLRIFLWAWWVSKAMEN